MSQPVVEYYDANAETEWHRLDQPLCRIEFASTLRLIQKHFPAGGRVCDIGSGPGRYALELARQGYGVTLLDISQRCIALARAAFDREKLSAESFLCGSARDLGALELAGFDAALLLGPMYHLVDLAARRQVLDGLWHALKPDAVAIIGFINSWGILRAGVADFPARYRDEAFVRSMLGDLSFERELPGFTECYWTTPPSASRELREAGFEVITYAGAEGFAGGLRPQIERLAVGDPEAYDTLLKLAAETSELPQYRDACDHLHFVVRKEVA